MRILRREDGVNTTTILLYGKPSSGTALLEGALRWMKYRVVSLNNPQSFGGVIRQQCPDLVFADDLFLCRWLRENQQTLPLFFYSPCPHPQDVAHALDEGADDYIVVPFGREELAARIRARLRRVHLAKRGSSSGSAPEILHSSDRAICLNIATHRVSVNHRDVHVTKTEFDLLGCFLREAGKVLTADFLLDEVWGSEHEGTENYVHLYVCRLRQKIERDPKHPTYLQTRLPRGYVFDHRAKQG